MANTEKYTRGTKVGRVRNLPAVIEKPSGRFTLPKGATPQSVLAQMQRAIGTGRRAIIQRVADIGRSAMLASNARRAASLEAQRKKLSNPEELEAWQKRARIIQRAARNRRDFQTANEIARSIHASHKQLRRSRERMARAARG